MDGSGHFSSAYTPYAHAQANQQTVASQTQPGQHPPPQHASQGLASFGSLSAPGHPQNASQHPTLPPLQAQNGSFAPFGSMQYHPGSQTQTPTTPHTPVSAGANATAYSQHVSPTNPNGAMLPPSFPSTTYVSQPMMYPPSTATATMPAASSSTGLPALRPMPTGGVSSASNGLPSLASAGQLGNMGQQNAFMQNEEPPTHVVGSQGRRGILPSAPGRPNPPQQGTQATKSMIPQKDADGKFPCPHCNKTYLHAKHLKRHLLRHTGDRPYMCHLCKDTFSRSDILKRHFQKCSLRRGNPTGANHLAHQRRNTNSGNRLSISQQEGPIGLAGLPEVAGQSNYNNSVANSPTVNGDMSARSSRANSLINPGNMSHRNSIAGLGILGQNGATGEQISTSANYQPGINAYAMQNHANGLQNNFAFNQSQLNGNMFGSGQAQQQQQQQQPMSFLGHQSSRFDSNPSDSPYQQVNGDGSAANLDWSRMFTQGGQDGFIGSQPANASSQGINNPKPEQNTDSKPDFHIQSDFSNDSFLGSLYSHPSGIGGEDADGSMPAFPIWGVDDPLQAKVDRLRNHCFPSGTGSLPDDPTTELMLECVRLDNVKHFIEHYTSFHGHWPILHMPTFKLAEANNNLVLAMLCIGAIYSPDPKWHVQRVRQMMEFVKATVFNSSSVYRRTITGQTQGLGSTPHDVEELQALSMLQTIFTWHGDPAQRQAARAEFPLIAKIAKAMSLHQTAAAGQYAYSPLHSVRGSDANSVDVSQWNWPSWLEQEKRNRLMYQVWLTDTALVTYFNTTPQFDSLEVRLMLPCDDAVWDASTPADCASALGLHGPQAQDTNRTGSRRPVQPTMRDALRSLLEPSSVLQNGATNTYSKFLLVHALIIRVAAYQKALLHPDGQMPGYSMGMNGSLPATPLSQNDWLEQNGDRSGPLSADNSGCGTPVEANGSNGAALQNAAQHEKKRLDQALKKWKSNWDHDIQLQYPPMQFHQRRFGFSRDGVHFFYLGLALLQSHNALDFSLPADQRFQQVMHLLKRIKTVANAANGENDHQGLMDLGGSVGDIDDQYGLDNLTLDMTLLFKPYDSRLDTPVASVQTHAL